MQVNAAKHWPTDVTLSQFREITKEPGFPAYLQKKIANDSVLKMYCNGEISYQVNGVHTKTVVTWQYKAAEGAGDNYEAFMRGTKANLVIQQGTGEKFQSTLYIKPVTKDEIYDSVLTQSFRSLQAKYPGIELKKLQEGFQVIIPEKYKEGHEAHFARVMQHFLEYLRNKNMPAWEVPGMLAKYYITTKALELSKEK